MDTKHKGSSRADSPEPERTLPTSGSSTVTSSGVTPSQQLSGQRGRAAGRERSPSSRRGKPAAASSGVHSSDATSPTGPFLSAQKTAKTPVQEDPASTSKTTQGVQQPERSWSKLGQSHLNRGRRSPGESLKGARKSSSAELGQGVEAESTPSMRHTSKTSAESGPSSPKRKALGSPHRLPLMQKPVSPSKESVSSKSLVSQAERPWSKVGQSRPDKGQRSPGESLKGARKSSSSERSQGVAAESTPSTRHTSKPSADGGLASPKRRDLGSPPRLPLMQKPLSPSKESVSSKGRQLKSESDSASSKGRPPRHPSKSPSRSKLRSSFERDMPGSETSRSHPTEDASSPVRDRQTGKPIGAPPTSQSRTGRDHDKVSSPVIVSDYPGQSVSKTPTTSDGCTFSKKRGGEPPSLPQRQPAPDLAASGELPEKISLTPRRKQGDGSKTPQSRRTSLASERSVMSEHDRNSPAIVVCSLLFVLSFLVIVAIVLVLTSEKGYPAVCASEACVQLSDLLNASLSATIKPCDNFYKYVCGGFPSGSRTSVYREHVERFGHSLVATTTEALVNSADQTAAQKVAVFVRSCLLAITYDQQSQIPEFRRKLTELGVVWPNVSETPDVVGTSTKIFATFRVAPLLKIERSRDGGNGEPPYLIVGPGTVTPAWKEQRDRLLGSGRYEQFYMATVVMYTGQQNSDRVSPSTTEIKKFLEMERMVLEKLVYADRDRAAVQRLGTVSELRNITPNIRYEAWQTAITKELGLPTTAMMEVANPEYLGHLNDLFGQMDEKDLHFYLGWCVVQAMGRLMSTSLSDLWYMGTKPELHAGKDLSFGSPSTADCMQLTESLFGWSLFQRFALTQAGPAVQNGVSAISETIAEDFTRRLETATWVEGKPSPLLAASVTKADFEDVLYHLKRFPAEDKLNAVLANLSGMHYSSFFANWINAASVMARVPRAMWDQVSSSYVADIRARQHFLAYDPAIEAIRVPPYFPLVPVFHENLTDGAKYGALGTLLGAAAVHLLMAKLSRNESLAAPLLNEARKRLACYAAGSVPRPLENSTAYLLRRVALAASLPVVWEAFRNPTLLGVGDQRGLRNFASDKSFFVTMCYILCDGRDSPAAAEFACNAAVKNVKAFAVAFRCPWEAPMHPRKKCQFFGQE